MNKHYLMPALALSVLTACNSGDGGDGGDNAKTTENPTPPAILTGSFIDSPVKGLRYETPTQSGLTNSLGEFTYQAGENVTFYIGGTQLGITQGADTVTPFSLLGISPLTSETEITTTLVINNEVSSFDRAINIATLLQTLDVDGNPENGIDLGSSHTVLKDIIIPLIVKARDFEHQDIIDEAKDLTGASHSRTLKKAIQHLYNSLDINIESKLTANYTSSQNNKQLDSIVFNYNSQGKLTAENTDSNNDGQIDIIKTFDYDDNGNLTLVTNSADDSIETLDYDDNNNLLSRTTDTQSGNDIAESYQYSNNRLARFEIDHNADGSIETSTLYSYDAQGNLSGHEIDRDNDGTTDALTTFSYSNNKLASYSEDSNNDGNPNIVITYTYDERGNRRSQNVDLAFGNTPKTTSTFEYDDNNNVIRYEQDRDLDGTADYIEASTYDQRNNRTSFKRDLDANGIWDVVTHYYYDINGNRIKMLEDSDGNGIADKVWTANYQAAILDNTWDVILEKL